MNRETTTTIHRPQHEKHTLHWNRIKPFLVIHSKESSARVKCEHCLFFFLRRGKTFILAALLQSQEVVGITTIVVGIGTITNLESI